MATSTSKTDTNDELSEESREAIRSVCNGSGESTPTGPSRSSEPDVLLTPRELSARAKVPLDTVYKWNSWGTGPPYIRLCGRHVRYRLSDVVTWENRQAVPESGRHAKGSGRS